MARMSRNTPQNQKPIFAIVDCNNFYASCERVFNPTLKNKPIVVLSNNDGCIIARSNEAKALGIKMGEPYFKALPIIKGNNIEVFSSNYTLYGNMSQRVMNVLSQFTPEIEYYSIDEAFLNLAGFEHLDLENYAKKIQKTTKKWTGIPVSIGVAPTKTLAKIANNLAKKSSLYKGVLYLENKEHIIEALKKTEIDDVWGIGRQYAKFLKAHNMSTAFDFARANEAWVRKNMSVVGLKTLHELRGITCIDLEEDHDKEDKKSLCVSKTFGKTIKDYNELKESLITYIARAGEKLRRENLAAKYLTIFIRTNPFTTSKIQYYSNYIGTTLPYPTDYTPDLIEAAKKLLNKVYVAGYDYKKAGILLSDFYPKTYQKFDLLDERNLETRTKLMNALDSLNSKYGRGTAIYAGSGINKPWRVKSDMRSPAYTTNWNDIITVK